MYTNERLRIRRRTILKAFIAACAAVALPAAAKNDRGTEVIDSRCVGCRDCKKICPKDAIRFHAGKASIDPEKCINCRLCEAICSYGAIKRWTN